MLSNPLNTGIDASLVSVKYRKADSRAFNVRVITTTHTHTLGRSISWRRIFYKNTSKNLFFLYFTLLFYSFTWDVYSTLHLINQFFVLIRRRDHKQKTSQGVIPGSTAIATERQQQKYNLIKWGANI